MKGIYERESASKSLVIKRRILCRNSKNSSITNKHRSLFSYISSGLALVVAVFIAVNVFIENDLRTNSDISYSPNQKSGFNVTLALGAGVNANMVITNTDGAGQSCDLTPNNITASGVIINCKVSITVNSTTAYGYTVNISNATAETKLVGAGSASGAYISPVSGSLADPVALSNSNWGYAIPSGQSISDNGFDASYAVAEQDTNSDLSVNPDYDSAFTSAKYAPIPASTSATKIRQTNQQADNDTFDIYFATRLNFSQLAGIYAGNVVISIDAIYDTTTNYLADVVMKNGISYMQELTPELCDSADYNNGVSNPKNVVTLIDKRDNKTYSIQKMADTRCWMMQSLALNNGAAITLTSELSDVSDSFDLPISKSSGTSVNTTAQVWKGQANYPDEVYYNWFAATAGTGTSAMTSGNATDSICPKNWRLPIGGEYATVAGDPTTTNNEFSKLDIAMGGTGQNRTSANTWTNWATNGSDGKHLNLNENTGFYLNGWNSDHYYGWSSSTLSWERVYMFGVLNINSQLTITDSFYKYVGLSIRCLVGE
jgi:uncharacterized protein (TIGR02145 family)